MNHHETVPSNVYDRKYYEASYGADDFSKNRTAPKFSRMLQVARIRPGHRVLDLGCGRGDLAFALARERARVVGLDYSDGALQIARDALARPGGGQEPRVNLTRADATRLPFANEEFDFVFMVDIVEHLYPGQLHLCFEECRRVLKKNGRLVIHTSPNRWYNDVGYPYWERPVNRILNKLFRQNLMTRWPVRTAMDVKVHVNEQTVPGLRKVLQRTGFISKIWLGNEYLLPVKKESSGMQFLEVCRQVVCHLVPLSLFPPLNYIFSNNIWAICRKPEPR